MGLKKLDKIMPGMVVELGENAWWATSLIKWFKEPDGTKELMQLWQNSSGQTQWRKVEVVELEELECGHE